MRSKLRKLKYRIQYLDLKYPYLKVILLILVILPFFIKGDKILNSIFKVIAFFIAVIFHEIAHGYVAYLFGDDTAKRAGRLTLNPLKHVDLQGLLLPAMLLILRSPIIIGSAKPVPVNYYKLRNNKIAIFMVSISGILSNLLLAFISLLIHYYVDNIYVSMLMFNIFTINVSIAAFNIIPIPPLDGSRVLRIFLPYELKEFFDRLEESPFTFFIILMIVLNTNLFSSIYKFLVSIISLWKF